MKVAVVGAGVSGLVAAHRLRERHDVHLFEASEQLGGHAHTVRVRSGGRDVDVDTGFVVYNERTYPLFSRLLAELGVATRPAEMSFSVSCERTGLEYNGGSVGGLFAQKRNLLRPSFLGMLCDVLRFYREAPELLDAGDSKVSLGDWLDGRGYGRAFVEQHLLPMAGAIWSCLPARVRAFPALAFVRFFANHGLLQLRDRPQWRVVEGGSARYVERIAAGLRGRAHVREGVRRVFRDSLGVELALASGARARFDRVVLAVHSDQALSFLAEPTRAERAVLSQIRFERNDVVLHCDERLLPRRRRARAAWNFRLPARDADAATATYDMRRLQGLDSPDELLVSLNQSQAIAPSRVLGRFAMHHPVFDRAALEAQHERALISGPNRTSYCGAYWGYGFHEDGVRSGLEAASEPWAS
jgi:hypothetical protein